jgi:hypothetical protein
MTAQLRTRCEWLREIVEGSLECLIEEDRRRIRRTRWDQSPAHLQQIAPDRTYQRPKSSRNPGKFHTAV